MNTQLLYLHGFNSSPLSAKAVQTKEYFAKHWPEVAFICPQLKTEPVAVIEQLKAILQSGTNCRWLIIGSSLGGYFATYFAERYQLPTVLVNPAVKPYELLQDYLGPQLNPYTQEHYQVDEHFIGQLKSIEQSQLTDKNRYFCMVQTGDEVLDYQQAVSKYQGTQLTIQQGGDHSFVDFEKMLPAIVKFFQLA